MIVLNVLIETNPGAVAQMKDAIAALEKATRVEDGCVDYVFATEINNPTTMRIVEHWRDVDALKAHLGAPHMGAFRQAMSQNPPIRMDLKMFDANELPFPPK